MNSPSPFQTLMREATRLTQAGQLQAATKALQRALGGGVRPSSEEATVTATTRTDDPSLILDGCVFETGERAATPLDPHPRPQARGHEEAQADPGAFAGASHMHAGITRRYKLYTPPRAMGQASALVVMLHGCTQNPDDFAAGTGMNALAREQGFMVLYPEQAQDGNPQRCWNWFKHNHQKRGSGEPALIASLTQMVVQQHGIDPRRVYIAGLSAGGAMAAVVATAYPEIFAAAGVHSGLPGSAAANVAEALMLMKNGGVPGGIGRGGLGTKPLVHQPVPTIIFHGDQDHTVHPRNGEQVLAAVLASQTGGASAQTDAGSGATVEHGVSPRGRRYTRSVYCDGTGTPVAEHWVVHGAGHAWSGGQASGSYTDATGPDASREMLRFFFSQRRGQAH